MFGMVVESEGGSERRWGRVVSGRRVMRGARRLRGYGDESEGGWVPDDWWTHNADVQPTAPADYVSQDPAQVPLADSAGGGDTPTGDAQLDFNANLQYDPSDPVGNTGFSQNQYNAILQAAQAAAQATGAILSATHNTNGTFSCPAGYIFNPTTRQCLPVPSGYASGLGLDTNTLLMVGAGGLGLLALFLLMK